MNDQNLARSHDAPTKRMAHDSIESQVIAYDYRNDPKARRADRVASPTAAQAALWSRGDIGTAGPARAAASSKAQKPKQYGW